MPIIKDADARTAIWNTLVEVGQALVAKDAGTFERLLTEDFVGAIPSGEYFHKSDYIAHHCRAGVGVTALHHGDMNAASFSMYDRTAIVSRRVHTDVVLPNGQLITHNVQRLEILVNDSNGWRMAGGQGTQVRPLGPPPQLP